jgi:PilZ domain
VRAQRFPLRISVRFRRVGDPEWHGGKTENISRSGILIRAEDYLPEGEVECRLPLTLESRGAEPPEVSCRGRVVRTVSASEKEASPGVAVAIEEFDFLREQGEQAPSASD